MTVRQLVCLAPGMILDTRRAAIMTATAAVRHPSLSGVVFSVLDTRTESVQKSPKDSSKQLCACRCICVCICICICICIRICPACVVRSTIFFSCSSFTLQSLVEHIEKKNKRNTFLKLKFFFRSELLQQLATGNWQRVSVIMPCTVFVSVRCVRLDWNMCVANTKAQDIACRPLSVACSFPDPLCLARAEPICVSCFSFLLSVLGRTKCRNWYSLERKHFNFHSMFDLFHSLAHGGVQLGPSQDQFVGHFYWKLWCDKWVP